jgi:hypothetical protein
MRWPSATTFGRAHRTRYRLACVGEVLRTGLLEADLEGNGAD